MYKKIISRILNKDFIKQDKAFFEYGLFDFENEKIFLDKENFHKIQNNEFNGQTCFIDGGSSELIKSSDIGLFFIRILGLIYKNNKKQKTIKKEFYALVTLTEDNKKQFYKFEKYNVDGELVEGDFLINIFDKTMMFGGKRVEISQVGDLIRTLSEIKLAKDITQELHEQDIIVLDGNLEIDKTHKFEYFKELYESAPKINICALSKTCNIITNKNRSIVPAIFDLKPEQNEFYYHPLHKSEQEYDTTFVKLNKNSDYLFRLDFSKQSNIKIIMQALKNNSNDFTFPGYPYGLIVADKFARISNKEKEYYLTILKTKSGDNWNIIKKHINTLNAHDVLDHIS
tara:strand:+ start:5136 stop:6161 length:1026 start_codon:yes stop_codon:yes gene_type:complete